MANQILKDYIKDLCKVLGIKESNYDVLMALLDIMDGNNQINLYPKLRKEMAAKLGFKHIGSFNNCISALCKSGVIKSVDSGFYVLDGTFCKAGEIEEMNSITLTISYSSKGKDIDVLIK